MRRIGFAAELGLVVAIGLSLTLHMPGAAEHGPSQRQPSTAEVEAAVAHADALAEAVNGGGRRASR